MTQEYTGPKPEDSAPVADPPSPQPSLDLDFPREGTLLGVDFGTVRIGIAICDPLWMLASPLAIRTVASKEVDGKYFCDLAKRERACGIVVGLPIHCDGGESQKSREARGFAMWLQDWTGVPVRLFDERFTTSAAHQKIRESSKKKGKNSRNRLVDAIAAQVLLESFLEAARYHRELPGQSPAAPASGGDSLE